MTRTPGVVEGGCRTFIILSIGGSVFYFVRGTLSGSFKGCRLAGGVQAIITSGPRVRRWAAWNGIEKVIVLGIQRVLAERPLNTMVSWGGGGANALFSVHRGKRVAVREGLKGATYGGLLEIVLYGIERLAGSGESSG